MTCRLRDLTGPAPALVAIISVVLVATGCRSGGGERFDATSAGIAAGASSAPGSGAVEAEEQAASANASSSPDGALAPGGTSDAGSARGGFDPAALAERLLSAVEAQDPAAVEAALRALGRRLAVLRGSGGVGPLVGAVEAFAAAGNEDLWRRVDGRYVVPAVEVLLDDGDPAALLRLSTWYADGPAGPSIAAARAEAERRLAPRD